MRIKRKCAIKECIEDPEYMVRSSIDPQGPFAYADRGVCWQHCEVMQFQMKQTMIINWPFFWSNVLAEHGFMPLQYNVKVEFLPFVSYIETGISP